MWYSGLKTLFSMKKKRMWNCVFNTIQRKQSTWQIPALPLKSVFLSSFEVLWRFSTRAQVTLICQYMITPSRHCVYRVANFKAFQLCTWYIVIAGCRFKVDPFRLRFEINNASYLTAVRVLYQPISQIDNKNCENWTPRTTAQTETRKRGIQRGVKWGRQAQD